MNGRILRGDEGLSLDEIAGRMRMSRGRVCRLEHDALRKVAIGLTLIELLGRAQGEEVLRALRGQGLPVWRRALADARDGAVRRTR